MGLGKITRGLGKVGAALEGVQLLWMAGAALIREMKGGPAAHRNNTRQDRDPPA